MSDQTGSDNIAVFGGSFDPPHKDHERLLNWLVTDCPTQWTKILVAVVDEHAFGKNLAPFEQREEMVKAMVKRAVPIGRFGRKSECDHVVRQSEKHTVDFLRRLRSEQETSDKDSQVLYHMVVGGDVLHDTDRWTPSWDELRRLATILPVIRKGTTIPEGWEPHEIESRGYSSTAIREKLAAGDLVGLLGEKGMLAPQTLAQIRAHGLYGWKELEYPEPKAVLGSQILPLTEVQGFLEQNAGFRLVGPIRHIFRVTEAVTEGGDPAVNFHFVADTSMYQDLKYDIEAWIGRNTDAWAEGKEFDEAPPQPRSPTIAVISPDSSLKRFPTDARHLGTVRGYEFFAFAESKWEPFSSLF